jgi:hypothetical protein
MNDAGRRRERRTYCINPAGASEPLRCATPRKYALNRKSRRWTPAAERSVFRGVRL